MLSEKLIKQSLANWKANKAMSLSTTFVGAIQLNGKATESLKTNPDSIESIAKERLAEESGSLISLPDASTKEDEFVLATFRALSATILADRPIDFTNQKILRDATPKLIGQTVFKDHNTSVNNWVGRVDASYWDEATPDIPVGINAILKLDAIKDPMTVRGVLQGAIHSASVTVSFEWKPSHPKLMDAGSFFDHLGEEIDGELVRIIVTMIDKFWEISLVWQGADEFAKQIGDDGKPVQKAHQPEAEPGLLAAEAHPSIENFNQENKMDPIRKLLKETFGVDVTEKNFSEQLATYVEMQIKSATQNFENEVKTLSAKIKEANQKIEALDASIKELEPKATLGSKYLEDERKEAIRLYRVAKGEQISEAILKTLEKADLEIAQAFKQEFKKEVEEKFPARCHRCGSTQLQRRSSVENGETPKTQAALNPETSKRLQDLHGI